MKTAFSKFTTSNFTDAFVVLDSSLKVISYSQKFKNYLFSTTDIIQGQFFIDLPINTPDKFLKKLENCLESGKSSLQKTKIKLKNDTKLWVKWKVNSLESSEEKGKGILLVIEDISKEIKFNELLLRAEKVSKTGSWEVDFINDKLFWSPMTRIIHEVPKDYNPSLASGINFYKEGRYRELITRLVTNAMENGVPWDTELILVTYKGNELWVRTQGEAEIKDGKCLRIFGTFQDIHAKKKKELKYRITADRLKIATDTSQIGIWEYKINENILVWDKNMYQLYGISETTFSGGYEAWENGIHVDDKERCNAEIGYAIEGLQNFDTEFRVVWPSGEVRNIRAIAKTEKNKQGKAIKLIGTNWDITELKSTRLKLERSKETFAETFKNSATGMALVSLDGKWIKVNNGLCNSLGYTEEELLLLTLYDITYPEDMVASKSLLEEVLNNKRDSFQLEKRYYHKSGGLVHAILTVTMVKDEFGKNSYFIAQMMNITQRIEAEQRLKALVELTKGQNESLLNFAHIVSHNLRSHSSNMSMLTRFLATEEDEEERKGLNTMLKNATDSLADTIEQLNEVVQVKTGALENMQSVSLLSYVTKIEHSIKGLIKEQEANIIVDVKKSHFVLAVPAYLESIILNLYTNALKYRSDSRKLVLKVKSYIKEDFIYIAFEDNGKGIDLKRHGDKIFGMYKTFHKNKDAKGIGLFITKNQVESMDGAIHVESDLEKGSTFFIKLKQG